MWRSRFHTFEAKVDIRDTVHTADVTAWIETRPDNQSIRAKIASVFIGKEDFTRTFIDDKSLRDLAVSTFLKQMEKAWDFGPQISNEWDGGNDAA